MHIFANSDPRRVAAFIFATTAAIILALTGYLTVERWNWIAAADHADGKVIALKRAMNGRSFEAVVAYSVADQDYRIIAQVAQFPSGYDVGDAVVVLYPASEPGKGRLESVFSLWGLPLILAFVGLGLAGATAISCWLLSAAPSQNT